MQVSHSRPSPPNSIQLSLFGFLSGATTLPLSRPESVPVRPFIGESPTDWPDVVLPLIQQPPALNGRNFRLTAGLFNPKTLGERIKTNVSAIQLAKQLAQEGRVATDDEKTRLVQFSGWGGLASAFEEGSRHLTVLAEVLTTEERQAAAASCLTAFYTPPAIIAAVWQAIEEFGFTGNGMPPNGMPPRRVLEPGAGIGHFLGFSPPSVNVRSEWVAVEKDPIAGLILGLLYPDATV